MAFRSHRHQPARRFLKAALAVCLPVACVAATPSHAGPNSYICTLTDYTAFGVEGREWVAKEALTTTLAIDRRTGAAIHPWLGTTNFNEVRVLHPGSTEWSFKLLADSGGGGHTVYIEVSEYVEGPKKPVIVVAGQVAYSGYCPQVPPLEVAFAVRAAFDAYCTGLVVILSANSGKGFYSEQVRIDVIHWLEGDHSKPMPKPYTAKTWKLVKMAKTEKGIEHPEAAFNIAQDVRNAIEHPNDELRLFDKEELVRASATLVEASLQMVEASGRLAYLEDDRTDPMLSPEADKVRAMVAAIGVATDAVVAATR